MKVLRLCALVIAGVVGLSATVVSAQEAPLADHVLVSAFDQIPAETFATIRDNYNIFYGHTSHGSQIISGLDILKDQDDQLYQPPGFHEIDDDLGHVGDTSWVQPTRDWLDDNPDCNMVMWSWCAGCSDNTVEGIDTYLAAMTQLENDYPAVIFVYMTGHLDGTGPAGNLYQRNNQIRDYCDTNNKVLFDFADIESWDPDGNYYPDDDDSCNWCSTWCVTNDCDACAFCAHSHCFNCFRKGKAFWSMMAAIVDPPLSGVGDLPAANDIHLSNYPNPFNPETAVQLRITKSGWGSLAVYDLSGTRVVTLYSGPFVAGEKSYRWQGRNERGQLQSSGVYICRLDLCGQRREIKMTLLK